MAASLALSWQLQPSAWRRGSDTKAAATKITTWLRHGGGQRAKWQKHLAKCSSGIRNQPLRKQHQSAKASEKAKAPSKRRINSGGESINGAKAAAKRQSGENRKYTAAIRRQRASAAWAWRRASSGEAERPPLRRNYA